MRQALVISFLAGLLLQAGCSIEGKNTAQEAQPPTAASASPDGNNVEPSGDAATPTADNSEGQPPTSDAESSFEKGMQAYRQDRNEEAVEAFQEAARLKPDYADAYLRLAYAHAALGQREESTKAFQQAAKAYERLTRSKLKDAGIYFNMGTAYAELGKWDDAVKAFKQAVKLQPDEGENHYELGVAHTKLAQYKEAVAELNEAVRLDPNNFRAGEALERAKGGLARREAFLKRLGKNAKKEAR
ncbi:MAG: tetratricopeptide repeat protein [Pyrinomonadaceae bacterium]|nr:tetratricopeptide repeat protein [Pyrinomonadaceae bacterium]